MPAPTVPLSEFDALVLPFAQGLPIPSARRFVRQAAIEFCEKTRCWREILTLVVDEQNETIVTPAYATIHEIEEAEFGGVDLIPTQFTDASQLLSNLGAPRYIAQTHPNTVALIPFATGTLTLSAFLKPLEGSQMESVGGMTVDALDVVPEFMLNQFGQKIADGALARALMVPRQDWSNPSEALFYAQKFQGHCDSNFARNITMQHRPPPRTKLYEF